MPDETPDNGAQSAFVFPARPELAVVRLVIKVEEVQGEGLLMSASMTPGNETWEHQAVEDVFRQALPAPQPGTYIFEANDSGVGYVSGPEEVTAVEGRDMAFFLQPAMTERRDQLVAALEAFPTSEVITEAARRIVSLINIGSLERNPFEVVPVVDARTVEVQGVDCIRCDFGLEGLLSAISAVFGAEATIDDGITTVGNIKFAIMNRNGLPVVRVGYLSHDSGDFATFLNAELAKRVHETIRAVALEAMTEVLAKNELALRQFKRWGDSMLATYSIDTASVAARVDAQEAEARARLAPPPVGEEPASPAAG